MDKITTIHTGPYGSGRVAFNPDNRFFANAGLTDSTVSVWDTTGKLIRTLDSISDVISTIDFSPDGSFLATGGNESGIQLWNTDSWENHQLVQNYKGPLQKLAFSSDGKVIACNRAIDHTTRIWNVKNGELVATLEFAPFTFHPSESLLVLSTEDKLICYDYSKKTLDDIKVDGLSGLRISFSPNGDLIASESHDGKICLWETKSFQINKVISYFQDTAECPVFSPSGKILGVAYSDSRYVILWDVSSGNRIDISSASFDMPNNLAFSPDGKILVCGGGGRSGGIIDMWRVPEEI